MDKKQSPHKKGLALLGWVLLVLFTVGISTTVIISMQNRGQALTESTVKYVEGRMDCQQVRIANISTNCAEKWVNLTNIGTLNIADVSAQVTDRGKENNHLIKVNLKPQGESKIIRIPELFKNLTITPIIKIDNELIGCKGKSVTVRC